MLFFLTLAKRVTSSLVPFQAFKVSAISGSPQAAFTTLLPHARRGSREAQGIIGSMYLTGQGVPLNHTLAYAWCHLAAANAPLLYTDPLACRDAAQTEMSLEQVLDARDLAVEIHNRHY